ncbi:uncharacterized protein [Bemisia tabaci]|uniref:uncharacterized protein n=1 Tax=Bemisia tabaci TaxID=7038 RepID=UPI003B2880AB
MDEDLDSEPVARVNLTAFGNWTEFNSEDLEEIGLTDLQTVILACLATLIPLTIALITALIARCFWKRYLKRKAIRCQGSLHRIESSDPRHTLQSSCDEMKTSESQFSVIPPEEIAEVMSCYSNGMALNPKSASNGSIITLTMRNNHLIVEKEERMPGMAPLPSKCFMSQGDTTIYTVDADDDNLSDYGNTSVSRTTSRDFLIHTQQQQPEERHPSGNGAPRSGYSVVPEEYLPFRKAWTEPESEDEGPFVVEEPKAQLPKIEEEFDEGAERRKLDQLQREKQDIQEQIKKYQEILQEAAAAASTTVLPAPQRLNGSLDDFNGERSGSDDILEDSEGEFVVDDYDDEDVESEEKERRQEDERWEAASKILIMNSEHLHDITLEKPGVGAAPVSEKGERTDAEDDWSTGFSEEEDDDQDFQFPRDARDFYRIENRKYDNLAQMQISQEEVPVPASTPADVAARPKGRPEHTQDIVVSNAPDRCSPYENVTNIDDYNFSEDDDDDDDDDKSNQENASVTTEINVGQSLVEKSGDSDDEKEKSKSSSSSRGSYQNDYSYGNQSEYTIDMSPSYCKQLVKELLPEPPSPFQNPLKGAPRVEDKTELYCVEKQHQMGKGFKSELSLPGDETFLSRTIISNNLSDSRDLN